MLAVAEKLTDGGFAEVTFPGVPEREHPVLPPGAGKRENFSRRCVACGLCIRVCPEQCLVASSSLKTLGQPRMDFRRGHCRLKCDRCGEVCPAGALEKIAKPSKKNWHLGYATWFQERCLRTTENETCNACERKCPVRAIHIVEAFPVVDKTACIGCGACEHVCPARPEPAMVVQGYEVQRVVTPINEKDLVAEMRRLIDGGASVVAAVNGVIVAQETGKGIAPLMKLHDEGKLRGALVVDKVIGKAAAAILIDGGAEKVYTALTCQAAEGLLKKHAVALVAEKTVPEILNREMSGSCPFESRVDGVEEVREMVRRLSK